jgi:predicted metal-binding protein
MTSFNILSTHLKFMPKHTLFVCQSCHHFPEERPEHQPADGTRLLEQLNTLCTDQLQSGDFEIQSVECLWTCDRPCAVAFSAPYKPTYLFTSVPTGSARCFADTARVALLQFGERYLGSKTGDIPWKQFPEALQEVSIAKIPGVK